MEVRQADPEPKDLFSPVCPKCSSVMLIRRLDPIVCTDGVQAVTYQCVACNTEVKRMIRRGK